MENMREICARFGAASIAGEESSHAPVALSGMGLQDARTQRRKATMRQHAAEPATRFRRNGERGTEREENKKVSPNGEEPLAGR